MLICWFFKKIGQILTNKSVWGFDQIWNIFFVTSQRAWQQPKYFLLFHFKIYFFQAPLGISVKSSARRMTLFGTLFLDNNLR